MACRFPGADGPAAFWRLLRDGVDAITEIPATRWDADAFYSSTPATPRRMITRWGGFLEDVDRFDAAFFRISPREAMRMDPQQRLLLEMAWEALEDAGQVPADLAGAAAGVFIGLSSGDYSRLHGDPLDSDAYNPTGNAASIAANRISYFFDLHGPSFTVDTACSSALVALHLACTSIWKGESTLGLAGGVNLILSPTNTINFSQSGMMSPDGRCKAFDASANGYVRAEGVGIVVIKPLSLAERDGDRIYALIRGSAVNQDGRTSGLTVPSQSAQEQVTREACRAAGVSPGEIDYVEAHGTGTPVGDPIEARALGNALSVGRAVERMCAIGSCKTNIGHPESAAGIAGVIKVALSLRHGQIPPSLHFRQPNPDIPFDALPLRVQRELGPWPERNRPSLAGVNSFGFGGTNAHIVLEQYVAAPEPDNETPACDDQTPKLFALSAASPEALRLLAAAHTSRLSDQSESSPLHDLCYMTGARRTHHEHRLAAVVRSHDELSDLLNAFLAGETRLGLYQGRAELDRPSKLAFVFAGQGSQWWGMGRAFLECERVYRDVIEECDALFRRHASWSLIDELRADEPRSRIHETEIAQPALFALQVGLSALWRSRGVVPDAVIGHSLGEVAAVHVAGVLSLRDAADVVFHRARLMQQATGKGRMAAVELSVEDAELALAGYEEAVSIAAVNGPTSVVLSGETAALEDVLNTLQSRDVFFRVLPVNYAFHSHQMDPYLGELGESLQGLSTHSPAIPIVSTVLGGSMKNHEDFGAPYWLRNLRHTVRFSAAVKELIESGHRLFVELSPHPTLSGVIAQNLKTCGAEGTFIPSLRRGEEDESVFVGGIGALYVSGFRIEWDRLFPRRGRYVSLPPYAWNRERHWLEPKADGFGWPLWSSPDQLQQHPLLGRRLDAAQPTWRTELGGDRFAYFHDHRVQGSALLPAAAFVETGLAAAREIHPGLASVVTEVEFRKPLFLGGEDGVLLEIAVTIESDETASFRILSRPAQDRDASSWTLHASGRMQTHADKTAAAPDSGQLARIRERCQLEVSPGDLYRQLEQSGLQYGPCFRGIEQVWRGDREALARVKAAPELLNDFSKYHVHPAVLDSCFQTLAAAVTGDAARSHDLFLPVGVGRIRAHDLAGPEVWCHARLAQRPGQSDDVLESDVRLFDEAGTVLVEVTGLRLQRLDSDARSNASAGDRFYETAWHLKQRPGQAPPHVEPDALPDPADLRAQLGRHLDRLMSLKALNRLDFDRMERWGNAQILEALRRLGWEPRVGDRFTSQELEARLGVASRHARLFERLLIRLRDAGVITASDGAWSVSAPDGEDEETLFRQLLAAFPGMQLDLQLQQRCGSSLAEVLSGARDPLDLIFPDGSLAGVERFYQDSPFVSTFSLLIQQAVSAAVDRLSAGSTLRILELGAGTGGTTAHILPALPREGVEYVYSDVSPVFTSHGAAKFADFPFCRFQLLDIEKDPLEQACSPHSFDLIIASNVLHATNDLRRVLANVRTLLADRGLLVLGEITGPTSLSDLVFALTDGWWRFQDFDLRPSYPLLSADQWQALLTTEGFTGVAAVPEDGRIRSNQTVLLARGPRVSPVVAADPAGDRFAAGAGTWLVFSHGGPFETGLVELLQTGDDRCLLVCSGDRYQRRDDGGFQIDPLRPEDFREVIDRWQEDASACRGVIYLWGLDEAAGLSSAATMGAPFDRFVGGALHLAQALASSQTTPRLWLITHGVAPLGDDLAASSATQASLWGLARVLANEHPELRCTVVDVSSRPSASEIRSLFEELPVDDREREIALRGPARYIHRAEHYGVRNHLKKRLTPKDGSFRLEVTRPGVFDSIVLRQAPRPQPGDGEVAIEIAASGLNFLDVLSALGLRPDQRARGSVTEIGMECAGTVYAVGGGVSHVRPGDDVIAVAPYSLSTHVLARSPFVVRKPDGMSHEDAATTPVAFLTAFYALHHLGRIQDGERILIHAAAGGVGLAAVQLARRAGAEIYATAGSPVKREYLRALGVPHVMDSRSLNFAQEIRERTGGAGVDLVLNSLAGEAISASLSLLRPNGRFLEIGKKDVYQNSQLGLSTLRNNRSFHAIDLIPLFAEQPESSGRMLRQVMSLVETGELQPLPYTAFSIAEAGNAFRYMAQARQIGKVIVVAEPQPVPVAAARSSALTLSPDATYLITGGLGGFGLVVAEWMVERGARHLVLMGRRGIRSEEAARAVTSMTEAGASVEVATVDVANRQDVDDLVRRITAGMPPLRGIVHAAMVLEDSTVLQLSLESLKRVMGPKHSGAWNLHAATLGQALDFFVLFGSMAALVGSPGQANYVAANAALDAFAHYRRSRGLPAVAIDWGRIGAVGYVARHQAVGDRLDRLGIKGMTPRQALDALERAIVENPVQIAVVDADWDSTRRSIDAPLLSALVPQRGGDAANEAEHAFRIALLATPKGERLTAVESYIQNELARALRLDAARIDPSKRLTSLGLDSLMAYEIKARIESDLGVPLPMIKLVGGPSISELAAYLLSQVESVSGAAATAPEPQQVTPEEPSAPEGDQERMIAELGQLSDEQVDSMLSHFSVEEQEAARETLT